MKNLLSLVFFSFTLATLSAQQAVPPEPYGATPSPQQVSWQQMEYYMFIHFGPNTFTDKEWGHGDEDPIVFNPTQLDARQWARIAKAAGMKAIIITAKHHDGFCLWPSEYSTHTVRESPWKDGKGDVLRELSKACKEYGLKFGVYLSPWDMNHPSYGTPEYNRIFANTLDEVLSNYGEVFEQWFDGANGEGPNGKRQEYDWPMFHEVVYKNQPKAIIFSDIGPGCRWVGNEAGIAGETNWSTLNTEGFEPGILAPDRKALNEGNEDGEEWVPAESDVSIRPGWFYSPSTDDKVKTLNHLLKIYYASVGRNSNLLLNVPVDRRGLIHANDSARLMELQEVLKESFKANMALGKKVEVSNVRGNEEEFGPQNLSDENYDTYWATDDHVQKASFTMDLGTPVEINRVILQEYIPLGQRVKSFNVEYWDGAQFEKIDEQTTIGYKRILVFPTLKTSKVRVNILKAKASPVLSEFQLYKAPEMMGTPEIKRDKNGVVQITSESMDVLITYTTDGTEPTMGSKAYEKAFEFPGSGIIKAKAFINRGGQSSETISADFDLAPKNWTILSASNGSKDFEAERAIDANTNTYWHTPTEEGMAFPHELAIDLGEEVAIQGFSYTPHQNTNNHRHGHNSGIIYRYSFYISEDGQNWEEVIHNGTFANIKNNPVKQEVKFDRTYKARYIKLVSLASVNGEENWSSAGEIGVITGSKVSSFSPLLKDVQRIVFLGNSITYSGQFIQDMEAYYKMHYPNRNLEFINVGLSSETVSGLSEPGHAEGKFPRPDLHERLERVLAQTKPDLVFACYGMNDGIYMPFDEGRFQKYKEGIDWMHELVVKAGVKMVHLTPPVYDAWKGGKTGYDKVLDKYSGWLLEQRKIKKWKVVDIHGPMKKYLEEQRTRNSGFSFAADGVHPDNLGHWIMAKQVLMYLGEEEVADAGEVKATMAENPHAEQVIKLVEERQVLMRDAWLTETGHKRPGVKAGLPLEEAKAKAALIEKQIRSMVKQ